MPSITYTEPGIHQFVWPDRVNTIFVECVGGGGGTVVPSPSCGGAGGGAYAAGYVSRPNSGITVFRVGARGRIVPPESGSVNGQSSFFETVEAGGGLGGGENSGNNRGVPISGDILYYGGNGGYPTSQTCDEYAIYLGDGGQAGSSSGDGADGEDYGYGAAGSYPGGGAGGSNGGNPQYGHDGIVILTWENPPPIPVHMGGWLRHRTTRYAPYKPGLRR